MTRPHLRPAAVAALYRQVRESLEDGKNEPGAADFYYGECEMRRHDTTRPLGERALLTAYWALSGYGLCAARAVGLAGGGHGRHGRGDGAVGPARGRAENTDHRLAGPTGQSLVLITDTPGPRDPTGPWAGRVTTGRFEKALRVVINSVVFCSSGQGLTTVGTYTEMSSRLVEPVLAGLAVLAVRSRVKR
jgi:hypothetical protein